MSGETEESVSGWTVDTLHSKFISTLNERDRRYEQRFEAQEEALKIALQNMRETATLIESHTRQWQAQSNEWRDAMNDRERTFMPRSEAEKVVESLTATFREANKVLQQRVDDTKADVARIEERLNLREGEMAGATARNQAAGAVIVQRVMMASMVVAAIGLAVTILIATR